MKIEKLRIKGFRNFCDTEIVFHKKSLILGANDVGKTNLIYALRLLFDKSISEHDLELSESDYNAYSGTDTIEITAYLSEVTEECLLSIFEGDVKDGLVVIKYTNQKSDNYKIFVGYDIETLHEKSTRQYIKRLNMQYVDTNRNLFSFLNRERNRMLQISKEKLSEEEEVKDNQKIQQIQYGLDTINGEISTLNYISNSLKQVNDELGKLSVHNEDQSVRFVAGESNADKLLDNLILAYSAGDMPLTIGGDGRNNQIFLATWIAKQRIQENIDHVTFYAIEEPESHLHPHQQRKLSEYIQNSFGAQVFITTHSPHIASKFNPESIVRLYTDNKYSFAACGGCSKMLKSVFDDFGYRLNSLSAEVFFSDRVFLVEGTSEVLFYTALAEAIGIDLDRYNISVLSVEGIGFKPYVAVCDALKIPWVLRTDNDIFTIPKKNPKEYYYAGITRILGIIEGIGDNGVGIIEYWKNNCHDNTWSGSKSPSKDAKKLNAFIRKSAEQLGIFLADVDLENDLSNSPLLDLLSQHYGKSKKTDIVKAMQKKKAENMLDFLNKNHERLTVLNDYKIADPLKMISKYVKERAHPTNDKAAD